MSAYSMYPSRKGVEHIKRAARQIMARGDPKFGNFGFEVHPHDAILQAGQEVIKKIVKKGIRAAKRDKRTREGLSPEKKRRGRKKKKSDGKKKRDLSPSPSPPPY